MSKIGFCAVAGSGMSALAQVSKYLGNDVYGSDRSFDQGKNLADKKKLKDIGIKIFPQDGSMPDKTFDILYASSAVEDTVPDIKKAKELHIPVKKRSDLLAEIFSSHEQGVAVGGTSGKSTITAMIGYILDRAGMAPLVINGALMKNYEHDKGIPNVILNRGKICVIEADESDGSIEKYTPYISVVSNISLDHKPLKELQELFSAFAGRAKKGAIYNRDCPNSALLASGNSLSFSIKDPSADFYAENISAVPDGTVYTFRGHSYKLGLIGKFNVANAMCATACCSLLGISPEISCRILESFSGTKRRLEVLGHKAGITVIDDFAHNPDKVSASMSALKSYKGRLLVMFQPHGFSPMRLMGRQIMESFAAYMDKSDILLLPEIFFAGGTVKRDISSSDLVGYAVTKNVNALYFQDRNKIKQYFLDNARSGDRIVLMGARDNSITDFGYELLEKLK